MKSFLSILIATWLVIVGVTTGITGCQSDQKLAAHFAVTYATSKYVEKAGDGASARATRVLAVVELIEGTATGEAVTIEQLKALVLLRLPENLSPADRTLALALIDAAVLELQARIGNGKLKPEQVVKVREVLAWVREGASQFVAAGP